MNRHRMASGRTTPDSSLALTVHIDLIPLDDLLSLQRLELGKANFQVGDTLVCGETQADAGVLVERAVSVEDRVRHENHGRGDHHVHDPASFGVLQSSDHLARTAVLSFCEFRTSPPMACAMHLVIVVSRSSLLSGRSLMAPVHPKTPGSSAFSFARAAPQSGGHPRMPSFWAAKGDIVRAVRPATWPGFPGSMAFYRLRDTAAGPKKALPS